jgi:hypothetical protein
MLAAVRVLPPRLPALAAGLLAAGLAATTVTLPVAPAAAADEPFLRGPHPFRKENALSLAAGFGVANGFDGVQAALDYGYEISGSLWFDVRFDLLDAGDNPAGSAASCPACAEVATFADVMAGLRYKLQTDIPLIPYGSAVVGPVFLFNQGASGAFGFALRVSAGAKYFLYDWLGLGLELGLLLGGAVVDEAAGLSSGLRMFDLGLGAEVQF